jgi:hypothetical protein
MRHIKSFNKFQIFEKKAEDNIASYRRVLSNEIFPQQSNSRQSINYELDRIRSIKWDVNNSKIKVFLDITSWFGKNQDLIGRGIIGIGAFQNWMKGKFKHSTEIVNHIGFIFSDGRIFHATTAKSGEDHKGVTFQTGQKYQEIISDPTNYMVYELPGDEKNIEDVANKLLKKIEDYLAQKSIIPEEEKQVNQPGAFYDIPGLKRYVIGGLVRPEPKNDLKFYCSELVANLLVRSKTITYEELKSLHTNESLDKYDEVSPTELLNLVMAKGDPAKLIIEYKSVRGKPTEPKIIDLKNYNID